MKIPLGLKEKKALLSSAFRRLPRSTAMLSLFIQDAIYVLEAVKNLNT
jgi:hypothetical protein